MSDLARSLIDAAKKAGDSEQLWPFSEDATRAAVVAVLETLAAHIANQPVELVDLMGHGIPFNEGKASVVDLMRRLAVEVKSEGR